MTKLWGGLERNTFLYWNINMEFGGRGEICRWICLWTWGRLKWSVCHGVCLKALRSPLTSMRPLSSVPVSTGPYGLYWDITPCFDTSREVTWGTQRRARLSRTFPQCDCIRWGGLLFNLNYKAVLLSVCLPTKWRVHLCWHPLGVFRLSCVPLCGLEHGVAALALGPVVANIPVWRASVCKQSWNACPGLMELSGSRDQCHQTSTPTLYILCHSCILLTPSWPVSREVCYHSCHPVCMLGSICKPGFAVVGTRSYVFFGWNL